MADMYKKEQNELIETILNSEKKLEKDEQPNIVLWLLLKTLQGLTYFRELTPVMINSFIRRIGAHNNDKYSEHCHLKIDLYFTALGIIGIPDEKEFLDIINNIQDNPQVYKVG